MKTRLLFSFLKGKPTAYDNLAEKVTKECENSNIDKLNQSKTNDKQTNNIDLIMKIFFSSYSKLCLKADFQLSLM